MIKNVGTVERIVRGIVGVALVAAGLSLDSGWKWLLLVLALVMFGTAALSYCPLTTALGLSTIGDKLNWGKKG